MRHRGVHNLRGTQAVNGYQSGRSEGQRGGMQALLNLKERQAGLLFHTSSRVRGFGP